MKRNLIAKIGIVAGCLSIAAFSMLNGIKIYEIINPSSIPVQEPKKLSLNPNLKFSYSYEPNEQFPYKLKMENKK